ncbi:MAG: DUF6517 family protein [Natronomonas sp.]
MDRRTFLAGSGGLALFGLAGCLGAVGLDEHTASPATVDSTTRSETGYEQTNVEEMVIREPIEVSGYSEEVVVTNYLTTLEKDVEIPVAGTKPLANFLVLTTPQVSILGREFNPVGDMSSEELLDLIVANYDEIGSVSHDRDESVTILDQETTASMFDGKATFEGNELDVKIHVSESVETASDLLVCVGVYPRSIIDVEADTVRRLMENVVKDVEGADE